MTAHIETEAVKVYRDMAESLRDIRDSLKTLCDHFTASKAPETPAPAPTWPGPRGKEVTAAYCMSCDAIIGSKWCTCKRGTSSAPRG